MSNNQNGKGSKPRPTNKSVYDKNFDNINWGQKPKTHVDYTVNGEYLKKHQEMEAQSWRKIKI